MVLHNSALVTTPLVISQDVCDFIFSNEIKICGVIQFWKQQSERKYFPTYMKRIYYTISTGYYAIFTGCYTISKGYYIISKVFLLGYMLVMERKGDSREPLK